MIVRKSIENYCYYHRLDGWMDGMLNITTTGATSFVLVERQKKPKQMEKNLRCYFGSEWLNEWKNI